MQWPDIEIDSKHVHLKSHYFSAFETLFRVENAIRILVYVVLKEKAGSGWVGQQIESDDGSKQAISTIGKQRRSQDAACGHVGFTSDCPLLYLTAGELVRVMLSDNAWPSFKRFLPMKPEFVKLKLEEIVSVRNALAHFRPVRPDDIDLVRANARHLLATAESYYRELLVGHQPVPPNREINWARGLAVKGTYVSTSLNLSTEESFAQIEMEVSVPFALTKGFLPSCSTMSVDTAHILTECPSLAAWCVCVRERLPPHIPSKRGADEMIRKIVRIDFHRSSIEKHSELIAKELARLVATIDAEIEMVRNDRTARGKLVRAAKVGAHPATRSEDYIIKAQDLMRQLLPGDRPEYWGGIVIDVHHPFSNSTDYPWMPMAVAVDDIPF